LAVGNGTRRLHDEITSGTARNNEQVATQLACLCVDTHVLYILYTQTTQEQMYGKYAGWLAGAMAASQLSPRRAKIYKSERERESAALGWIRAHSFASSRCLTTIYSTRGLIDGRSAETHHPI